MMHSQRATVSRWEMNIMMKCPFCQFDNEDGSLFCEQCKSDLGATSAEVGASQVSAHAPQPRPAEAVPMAAVPESPAPLGGSAETISGNASLGSLGSAETLAPSGVSAPVAEAVPVAPARPDAPLMAEAVPALPGVPLAPGDLDR